MIKVLLKADRVFGIIAGNDGVSFTELQGETDMNKATLSNLLKSLTELGMVRRNDKTFHIGERLVELARHEVLAGQLSGIAMTYARRLGTRLPGLIMIAVREGSIRHIIGSYDNAASLSVKTDGMYDTSLYNCATGRILLAFAAAEQRENIFGEFGLPDARWWPEATSKRKLFAALDAIRKQEYVCLKNPDGLTEMSAVPVFYPDGSFCAAMGHAAPRFDMNERRRDEIRAALQDGAAGMTRAMEVAGIYSVSTTTQEKNKE